MRNGNFLKIRVSEICVKQIRVNQGLGVFQLGRADYAYNFALFLPSFETSCATVIVQLYNGVKGGN